MTDTPEMVERVARAIWQHDCLQESEGCPSVDWMPEVYIPQARAAIDAMREPTREMILDAETALDDFMDSSVSSGPDGEMYPYDYKLPGWERGVWQAMVKAAFGKREDQQG